ncbi:MAG: hypothetical protein ACRDIC_02535 [bacterium]
MAQEPDTLLGQFSGMAASGEVLFSLFVGIAEFDEKIKPRPRLAQKIPTLKDGDWELLPGKKMRVTIRFEARVHVARRPPGHGPRYGLDLPHAAEPATTPDLLEQARGPLDVGKHKRHRPGLADWPSGLPDICEEEGDCACWQARHGILPAGAAGGSVCSGRFFDYGSVGFLSDMHAPAGEDAFTVNNGAFDPERPLSRFTRITVTSPALWARGEYVPLLFSRQRIEEAAGRLMLLPR